MTTTTLKTRTDVHDGSSPQNGVFGNLASRVMLINAAFANRANQPVPIARSAVNFRLCDIAVFDSQGRYRGKRLLSPPEPHANRLDKIVVPPAEGYLMSYDLEIWSVRPLFQAPAETKVAWQARPGGWSSGTRTWQFVIEDSVRVEPEDLSADVARSLPGVRYLSRFYLEGDSSSKLVSQALTTAKGIAKSLHGLVAEVVR